MNIFATSYCPIESARALDDKRINKMMIESAQMLSSAMHRHGIDGPYKLTHKNHPCTLWAGNSMENFNWLLMHLKELSNQWRKRLYNPHKCSELIPIFEACNFLPSSFLEPNYNASLFKSVNDVHLAYKLTMVFKWTRLDKRPPKWSVVGKPEWYDDTVRLLDNLIEQQLI